MSVPGDIVCETPGGRIAVRGAAPVIPLLRHLAPAWPVQHPSADHNEMAMVTATFDGQMWRYESTAYDSPDYGFLPGLGAANGLVGAMLGTMLACNPTWISLHAGAAEIDGRLVLMIGANMAGKSTLATALAAAGCRLWSDDRVLLMPGTGRVTEGDGWRVMALGLSAKVRLPLPDTAPGSYRSWVHSRRRLVGEDMAYLQTGDNECAPAGAITQPHAILVPDRVPDGPAFAVTSLARGQVVKHLVPAAFAPALSAIERLQRLGKLAAQLDARLLQYRDVFDILPRLQHGYRTDEWGTD